MYIHILTIYEYDCGGRVRKQTPTAGEKKDYCWETAPDDTDRGGRVPSFSSPLQKFSLFPRARGWSTYCSLNCARPTPLALDSRARSSVSRGLST